MSPPGDGDDRAGDLEEEEKDILEVVLALTDFTGLGETQVGQWGRYFIIAQIKLNTYRYTNCMSNVITYKL